jgi:hypothetical protein
LNARDCADVDNRASLTLLLYLAHCRLGQNECTPQVAEKTIQFFQRVTCKRTGMKDACIVNQHIHSRKLRDGCIDNLIGCFRPGDISNQGSGKIWTVRVFNRRCKLCLGLPDEHGVGTPLDEPFGVRITDPG